MGAVAGNQTLQQSSGYVSVDDVAVVCCGFSSCCSGSEDVEPVLAPLSPEFGYCCFVSAVTVEASAAAAVVSSALCAESVEEPTTPCVVAAGVGVAHAVYAVAQVIAVQVVQMDVFAAIVQNHRHYLPK